MDYIPFADKFNAAVGFIGAVLTMVFGKEWFLFVGFFVLNVMDYITGVIKSKINKKENSVDGLKGVLKKLAYWIMILLAFGLSGIFMELGSLLNVNLAFTTVIGWFVLASLIINEVRSILENLVESGVAIPAILIKGLKVAEKLVEKAEDSIDGILHVDTSDESVDKYHLDVQIPLEDLQGKDHVTFKIDKDGKITQEKPGE